MIIQFIYYASLSIYNLYNLFQFYLLIKYFNKIDVLNPVAPAGFILKYKLQHYTYATSHAPCYVKAQQCRYAHTSIPN